MEDNAVVIGPPHLRGSKFLAGIPRRRVAFLSGWAMEPGAVHRYGCDAAFPLSDHADYEGLWQAVEQTAPRRVLTVHGFAAEFARDLRARGVEAWALTGADQLDLGLAEEAAPSFLVRESPPPTVPSGDLPTSGFGRFCQVCEEVAACSGRLAKIRVVADYLQRLRETDLIRCAVWFTGSPFSRSSGESPGVGSSLLRKALQEACGEPESVVRQTARRCGETGRAALELLAGRSGTRRPEPGDIQALFQRLHSTRSSLDRLDLLTEWFCHLSPLEVCYLVKLCSGDLRIGLREGLVEEAVAAAFQQNPEAVRQAHMLTGDIGQTAALARQKRLDTASMTLFRPISCMLAGVEHDGGALWKRFAALPGFDGTLWVEDKMDGVRAQLHVGGGRAEIYSRDLKPLSSAFPEIVKAAALLPVSCVLDGEILAWRDSCPLPFSELQKRLGRKQEDLFFAGEVPVRFLAFDCLQREGTTLLRLPLRDRRVILESLPLSSPLGLAAVRAISGMADIDPVFREVRAAGHEGLVLKDPASFYTPGRRGLSWIKRKRALATLDVVVVAVEYGHGKRAGVLSDYTFAVRDDGGHLLVIGKAYTGLTDAEISEMTGVFLALTRRKQGRKIEVRPEVVVEVAFDSIRESDRHASGLALRFPRIKRLRPDKSAAGIDTIQTARALLESNGAN